MAEATEDTEEIFRRNLTALSGNKSSVSMCELSKHIQKCDNYIQKILTKKINPNLDTISSVSNSFDLKNWEMIYPRCKMNPALLTDIQALNRLSSSELALVWDYIEFILPQCAPFPAQ